MMTCMAGLLLKYNEADNDSKDIAALLMLSGNAILISVAGISAYRYVTGSKAGR